MIVTVPSNAMWTSACGENPARRSAAWEIAGDGLTGVRGAPRIASPAPSPARKPRRLIWEAHLPPAAFLIAVRIRVYVPQRQMLPAIE
jgi:hypothetical protein